MTPNQFGFFVGAMIPLLIMARIFSKGPQR